MNLQNASEKFVAAEKELRDVVVRHRSCHDELRNYIHATSGWARVHEQTTKELYALFCKAYASDPQARGMHERLGELTAEAAEKRTKLDALAEKIKAEVTTRGEKRDAELKEAYDRLVEKIAALVLPFSRGEEDALEVARSCEVPSLIHERLFRWLRAGDPAAAARILHVELETPLPEIS